MAVAEHGDEDSAYGIEVALALGVPIIKAFGSFDD